jgi:serine/threonine protein kinase
MDNQDISTLGSNDPLSNLDLHPGLVIARRYEILLLLGRGGMSVAYKALDKRLNRVVTVKFLLPERLANPKDRARFQREAMAAGQLQHPGISKVFEFDFDQHSRPFLVMEYIEGQTLAHCIQTEGQLPIEETIKLFIEVTDALAFAHAHKVLHRDIKPSNIMLTTPQRGQASSAKILDFGLAKLLQDKGAPAMNITNTGEILGSPFYMSPEQSRGAQVDVRSDLYSVGCTIYEALTGSPPHLGNTALATILKRETDRPISMSEASLGRTFPTGLERIVSKLLETDPDNRYQTAEDLLVDLGNLNSNGAFDPDQKSASPEMRTPLSRNVSPLRSKRAVVSLLIIAALPLLGIAWFKAMRENSRPKLEKRQPLPETFTRDFKPERDWLSAQSFLDEAQNYKANGQFARALAAYNKALATYQKMHAPRNADAVDVLLDMADCYLMQNNCAEARSCVEKSMAICSDIFGAVSRNFASTLNTTGIRCLKPSPANLSEVWQISEPLFKRSEFIYHSLYGAMSDKLALSLCEQADACLARGLTREATSRCDKIMPFLEDFGPEPTGMNIHALTLATQVYGQLGDLRKLDRISQFVVKSYNNVEPTGKRVFAEWILIIANELIKNADKDKQSKVIVGRALLLYESYLPIYEQSPDLGQVKVLRKRQTLLESYKLLGRYYRSEGDHGKKDGYRLAESYYSRAVPLLQEDNEAGLQLEQTLEEIGYLAKLQGHLDQAKGMFDKARVAANKRH